MSGERLLLVEQVEERRVSVKEAASQLGISVRQLRRLRRAYRISGLTGLIHGNRGRRPHNKLDGWVSESVLQLARGLSAGCSEHRLTELARAHGVAISRSTVHRILKGAKRSRYDGLAVSA